MAMEKTSSRRGLAPATARRGSIDVIAAVVRVAVMLLLAMPYMVAIGRHQPWLWQNLAAFAVFLGVSQLVVLWMRRSGPLTWLRVIKWGALGALASVALLVAATAGVIWYFSRGLPSIEGLQDFKPPQVTAVLDMHGDRIDEIYTQRRTVVPFSKIPKLVQNAFVAAEDGNFWEHGGVDYWGIVRAVWNNVKGESTQGASTITQQVVKNMVLTPERTFRRKIQEMILARRLETELTKEEIFAIYLNEIYFGHGRYGVQEAARFYFGKDVDQLDIGEAALLGGLPKSPEDISPLHDPKRAKERQTYVLNREVELGFITREQAQKFVDAPIMVAKNPFPRLGSAPEWNGIARAELEKTIGKDALDTLGGKVKLTVDPDIQAAARRALIAGLRAYDERHDLGRPHRTLKNDAAITKELDKLAKQLPKGGPRAKERYDAIVTGVRDSDNEVDVDLGHLPATIMLGGDDDARYNPPGADGAIKPPGKRFARGDVVTVMVGTGTPKHGTRVVKFPPGPEGAVAVIDVKTRKVRALVGGFAMRAGGLDRATDAHRQPGSSFKPILYAAAVDTGQYTAASIVNDAPDVFDNPGVGVYKPQNYEKNDYEGPIRLRLALAKSINTVAIRVCAAITPAVVVAYAHKLGIVSDLPEVLPIALGAGEVTPLEMTNAMATLAAGGKYAPPRFIESVDGKAAKDEPAVQVIKPETAYVIVDMMRSVIEEGTGFRAKKLGIPLAGKTGTSNKSKDAWFMGLTPDYAIGVWIGYDEPLSLGSKEAGGVTAVPVFVDLASAMHLPGRKFTPPGGVVEVAIDKATGLRAAEGAPGSSQLHEVFVKGTEPTETAPLPGEATSDTFVTDEYDEAPSGGGDDDQPVNHP
ncbi:MAG: PBP1A family penicillin-binding protein [Deltaproteobacteria bacterium]|nr:PBP1A family penicillin-binding protein [Deltaproteobacteria bacterium]